jgi:hypothetical protein
LISAWLSPPLSPPNTSAIPAVCFKLQTARLRWNASTQLVKQDHFVAFHTCSLKGDKLVKNLLKYGFI